MKTANLSHTLLSHFEKDFKAEVIAAEIAEHGTDAERILILMLGAMKRTFSKDVSTVEEEISAYDHKEYVLVKTPREGIYDMLPQGLFHQPAVNRLGKSVKELIRAIDLRKEEERNARRFFMPFEIAINYLRMQMAIYENRLDKRSHYNDLVNLFADHWAIFRYLDGRQASIFLHLIPIIYDIRDDHTVAETALEMIFLLPAKVSLRRQLPQRPPDPILSRMGQSLLGVDFTTGNAVYDEGADEVLVQIGPMPNEMLQEFLPGGRNSKILELLKDYLLPVHLDIVTELILDERDKVTRLADDQSRTNSVLGADTYL
jgi:type VI secretion system protein ImpH